MHLYLKLAISFQLINPFLNVRNFKKFRQLKLFETAPLHCDCVCEIQLVQLRWKFRDFFFMISFSLWRPRDAEKYFQKFSGPRLTPFFLGLLTEFSNSPYSLKYSNEIRTKFKNQKRQIPSNFFFQFNRKRNYENFLLLKY